jgi:nucleotide-binding universal stress UspA family protein
MIDVKKILFPVDLSEVSPKIAPWALTVVKQFDAEIHLLFVARKFEHFTDIYVIPGTIKNFEEEVIKRAEIKIREFAEKHLEGYSACKIKVVHGDPAQEILHYISSEKIDLVIMGTHGRKGIDWVLFGSVADSVIKMSPAPVLSINPYRVSGMS